jgi:Tol biopolymer transport system component
MLAALNHPNIATIHGLEQSNGTSYLVMELVSGETLGDRVKREGAVPIEEALTIAKQIAEALEAAHEKGIIHRDLKPANVKLTPEGKVKVLDFGLAKAFEGDSANEDIGNSPTLSRAATMQGVILGTAAYMSPEQAKGKAVDKRTDIWAFGAVLYELLTGKAAFHGEDITDILAAVVRAEPDWTVLPANISPSIRVLLQRCLRKDRRQRTPDAATIRIEIEDAIAAPKDSGATQAPVSMSKLLFAVGVVAAALAIIAVVALWGWWRSAQPVERALVRLDVDLGTDVSLGSPVGVDAVISPDGNRLVFVSKSRLFTRRLDLPKATELIGTEGAFAPFFSPDGQWVAFFTDGKLKKISVEGGSPITLCDAQSGRGGSWGEDHNIIAALTTTGGVLSQVPDVGGAPKALTELAPGEITHRWPQILPGDKAVLFTSHRNSVTGFDSASIEVVTLQDHRRKTLLQGGTYGRYLPTSNTSKGAGHLIYINKGTLFAVPFDLDRLEVRGTPAPLLEQVSYSATSGTAQFDFSRAGMLVYRSGLEQGGIETLQWLDSGGKLQPVLAKPGSYSAPHVSPDGKLVALSVSSGGGSDIWVYDWQRDATAHLTFGGGTFTFPVWSPDGRYVVFHGDTGIFWARADGAGKPQLLIEGQYGQFPWSFSPDGKRLAYAEQSQQNQLDIWTVPVENDGSQLRAGKPEAFLRTPANELYPAFSPDGRWIAYRSMESGNSEIYVRAFPDKGGKWLISNSGGVVPVWSRNAAELFYRTSEQQIMVVPYTTKEDSFLAGKPRLWSEKRLAETATSQNLDITPDGKRFAVLMPAAQQEDRGAPTHLIFLMNFFDEIRRKVPPGK